MKTIISEIPSQC